MNYYYRKENVNEGPVSLETLKDLFEKGIIKNDTPVIEEGGASWFLYEKISGESQTLSSGNQRGRVNLSGEKEDNWKLVELGINNITDLFIRFNERIDILFERQADWIFQKIRDKAGMKKILAMGNSLMTILSCLLLLVYGGKFILNIDKPILIIPLILGVVVVQYLLYYVNKTNAELAIQDDICLSTILWPRLLAMSSYVLSGLCVAGAVLVLINGGRGWMTMFFLSCVGATFSFLMFVLYWKSDRYLLNINNGSVSGGMELVAIVRYILRFHFIILQVEGPLLMATGLIVTIINPNFVYLSMPLVGILILLPLVNYVIYLFLSLIPDWLYNILRKNSH